MIRFSPFSLNIKGSVWTFSQPLIMGILNVTPDSFYAGSHTTEESAIRERAAKMLEEGANIIDIGGYSSRPNADEVPVEEEIRRVVKGIKAVRELSTDILISVDTFRSEVAETAVTEYGADIINDISGGDLDPNMINVVPRLKVPYIIMHMRGNPGTMSRLTDYADVTGDVLRELSIKIETFTHAGVNDIIIDPGFGFAKTLEQNYDMLSHLELFQVFELPVLVGISRKSMIYKALDTTPENALNGTTVINTIAMLNGASILRVHDVKEAVEARKIIQLTYNPANL